MPILQALGPSAGRASPPPQTSRATTARRDVAVPMPTLEWNEEVAHDTAHLYERVRAVIPAVEWPFFAPYVKAINALKRVRNAVILAHNYQTPEIYNCVADFVGDSLQLAREAMKVDADIIVQCGVHFMAETSKILNPDKTVLIPDLKAGCSLASSISGANALEVVESLGADTVIFLPDQYLAKYVAAHTKVKIISWHGACEVHERFTADELRHYREGDPSLKIIAHPECPPDVLAEADYTGSTAGMIEWVRNKRPRRVVMVTECSMADNVQAELPDVEFVRPCNLCPHMKRITLPKILESLVYLKEEVVIDPAIAARARRSVERMVSLKR